jgi:hypothetical protein
MVKKRDFSYKQVEGRDLPGVFFLNYFSRLLRVLFKNLAENDLAYISRRLLPIPKGLSYSGSGAAGLAPVSP